MAADLSPASQPRPGRPRNERCNEAISAAALDLLVSEGFGRMSMEGIAARAGVGKATIYRRWATKEELVVDAVAHRCVDTPVVPDTGSVRDDLIALLRSVVERFQRDGSIMQSFAAEQARHPELAQAFRSTFLAGRRAAAQEIIRRGIERGELRDGTDVELLADAGPALLWHRLTVTGRPLDDDLPQRIVAQFLPTPPPAERAASSARTAVSSRSSGGRARSGTWS